MVRATHLEMYGNQFRVQYDDGSVDMAYPTMGSVWIVSSNGGVTPTGDFIWPFPPDQITSGFRTPERPTHDGIDFGIGPSNTEGTPIPATAAGTVEVAGVYFGYGNTVILNHGVLTTGSHAGKTLKTLYGHMVDPGPVVSVGNTVTQGQTLGGIGNTGQSQGNHLHWETWVDDVKIDPELFMAEYGPA